MSTQIGVIVNDNCPGKYLRGGQITDWGNAWEDLFLRAWYRQSKKCTLMLIITIMWYNISCENLIF